MRKITNDYRRKIQQTINSTPKGKGHTTVKVFHKQCAKYDKYVADGYITRKEANQKKRNFGRAFTNAVKRGEYENIKYTDKNKQNASTFCIF